MNDSEVAERPAGAERVHEDDFLERLTIDTIRTLAMDAVQKSNLGHSGTPLALAPVGYALWSQFLRTDPAVPDWPDRDRFVLSVETLTANMAEARHALAEAEQLGLDRDGVTETPVAEGVASFSKAFDHLLGAIAAKHQPPPETGRPE